MKTISNEKPKQISPGMTLSYKTPVIKGEEGNEFYHWINNSKKNGYKSLNSLITEALKLKYMLDMLKLKSLPKEADGRHLINNETSNIPELEDIEILNEGSNNIGSTFKSIKR